MGSGCWRGYIAGMAYRTIEVSLSAWESALRALEGGQLSDEAWAQLAEAGLADGASLEANWATAMAFHATSAGGFNVNSAYDDVLLQTNIALSLEGIVTSLHVRRVETAAGVVLDPLVEFAVGRGARQMSAVPPDQQASLDSFAASAGLSDFHGGVMSENVVTFQRQSLATD